MLTLSPYETRIVDWMTEHGHPGYRLHLDRLAAEYLEASTPGEARAIRTDFEETARDATDRYEDWASD